MFGDRLLPSKEHLQQHMLLNNVLLHFLTLTKSILKCSSELLEYTIALPYLHQRIFKMRCCMVRMHQCTFEMGGCIVTHISTHP